MGSCFDCFTCLLCEQKTAELKLEHFGDGPLQNIVPRCHFYKLPHKVNANLCTASFVALTLAAMQCLFRRATEVLCRLIDYGKIVRCVA